MKRVLLIIKKWFLEEFIYYFLEDKSLELSEKLRNLARYDKLKACVYIQSKQHHYPFIIVVYKNNKRIFEGKFCVEKNDFDKIAKKIIEKL